MKISDILEPCSLKLITGDPERTISGFYACDLLSWVISHAKEGDLWVTVMNNINILAVASLVDVGPASSYRRHRNSGFPDGESSASAKLRCFPRRCRPRS